MKKLWKPFYEIFIALILAHKWHTSFRKVLQFVRADYYWRRKFIRNKVL